MATVSNVMDDVLSMLQGWTRTLDQSTHITAAVSAGDLTWSVADATQVSRGVAEIDSELVWVDSVNRSTNQITVAPYGRGFRGTTAASHSQNARLVFSPITPRIAVFNAVNDTLLACTPDLFQVASTTFTYLSAVAAYALPADSGDVLSVTWQVPGSSGVWEPVRRWVVDSTANTGVYATGRSISLYDAILPGRTVQVAYTKDLTPYAAESDNVTVSGLPATAVDVLKFGAAARVVAGLDAVRIAPSAVSVNQLDDKGQVGSAGALSQRLYLMHRQRLDEEHRKLLDAYPVTIHYQR